LTKLKKVRSPFLFFSLKILWLRSSANKSF
jgi:hypothetical protein